MRAEAGTPPRLSVIGAEPSRSGRAGVSLARELLSENMIVGFEKLDPRAHAFIRLRSKLISLAKDTGQHIFAVTSVEPSAGKTHVAINLAAALSRITPTVLIELDLRRPSIGSRLGLPAPCRGIDDFLEGEALWGEMGVHIHGFSLDVHCVRTSRDNAEELLTTGGLEKLFGKLRANEGSPICIVDTSPMAVDDDLMLIAPAIDGVLMVVEEGRTSRRALLEATDTLKTTPIVGSILNKSIWTKSGAEYGYYGSQ